MNEPIVFTRAYREDGAPVGKVFQIVDGHIQQDKNAKRHPDRFEVIAIEPGRALAQWVHALTASELVVAGVPKNGATSGSIVPKARRAPGYIALSDEDFDWPEGPGLFLLDFDPKSPEEGWDPRLSLSVDQFVGVLEDVVPGITASFNTWPSSGSCIRGEGVEPRGLRGFHCALPVRDATDIPRAGRALHRRLILAGYGFPFVTKSGVVLVRSIVDAAVWRPAQPLFLGGAFCGPGLNQDGRKEYFSSPKGGCRGLLDTINLLPDLTEEEAMNFEAECRRMIEGAAPLAEKRRAEYDAWVVEARANRIAATTGCTVDEARRQAAQGRETEWASARRRPDGRREMRLARDAEVVTAKGVVTVADILAAPLDWHGVPCADPEEPDYGKGVGVARIHTSGTPNINSFAHGGCLYWLARPTAQEEFDDFGDDEMVGPPESATTSTQLQGSQALGSDAGQSDASGTSDRPASTKPVRSRRPPGASGVVDAAALMRQEFPPVQWTVDGLLPRGCWVLAGKPKTGKSWFALDLLLSVAASRQFLGMETDCGPVLYLALEDNDRRMQQRLKQLGATALAPGALGRFKYQTAWPGGEDCTKQLDTYLRMNPGVRLVAVDTLAKVKREPGRSGTAYDQDYAALGPFHEIATKHGICLLLVTHLRKAQSTDTFDDISGSTAVIGAVDGAMILARTDNKRLSLKVRGRDLDDDKELVLERDEAGHFKVVGAAAEVAVNDQRLQILYHLELASTDGATAAEIHKARGLRDPRATRRLLARMVDDWLLMRRGSRYYLPDHAPGGDDTADCAGGRAPATPPNAPPPPSSR